MNTEGKPENKGVLKRFFGFFDAGLFFIFSIMMLGVLVFWVVLEVSISDRNARLREKAERKAEITQRHELMQRNNELLMQLDSTLKALAACSKTDAE